MFVSLFGPKSDYFLRMADRIFGEIAFVDQKRNILANQVDLVRDSVIREIRMNRKIGQKFWLGGIFAGFDLRDIFVGEEGDEAAAGHEGVETSPMSGATLTRTILTFWKMFVR